MSRSLRRSISIKLMLTIPSAGVSAGPRATIRAQTPPSVTNISTGFVRGAIPPRYMYETYDSNLADCKPGPFTYSCLSTTKLKSNREPRTPSPAGTVIPTAATWMTGNQPVQLIRTNIGHSPRATITQSPRTKIESKLSPVLAMLVALRRALLIPATAMLTHLTLVNFHL